MSAAASETTRRELKRFVMWMTYAMLTIYLFDGPSWAAFLGGAIASYVAVPSKS